MKTGKLLDRTSALNILVERLDDTKIHCLVIFSYIYVLYWISVCLCLTLDFSHPFGMNLLCSSMFIRILCCIYPPRYPSSRYIWFCSRVPFFFNIYRYLPHICLFVQGSTYFNLLELFQSLWNNSTPYAVKSMQHLKLNTALSRTGF